MRNRFTQKAKTTNTMTEAQDLAIAVELFLIDAPQVVPMEFQDWTAAKERHRIAFRREFDAHSMGMSDQDLDAEAVRAKVAADRLERHAWRAWERALEAQAA